MSRADSHDVTLRAFQMVLGRRFTGHVTVDARMVESGAFEYLGPWLDSLRCRLSPGATWEVLL